MNQDGRLAVLNLVISGMPSILSDITTHIVEDYSEF